MVTVSGFEYRITIPFEGHLGLFRHSSPLSPGDSPRAKANEDGVTLVASGYNLTRENLGACPFSHFGRPRREYNSPKSAIRSRHFHRSR